MPQKSKNTDWKKRLNDLSPDEKVWMNIERELDFEVRLAEGLKHLPVHVPDTQAWSKISECLPERKSVRLPGRILTIAAMLAVLLATTVFMLYVHVGNVNVEESLVNNTLTENDMEQVAMAEIRNQCNLHMPVCERTDFRELMQLYEELKAEEVALKSAINTLGDSPEMIQSLVKIENLKSETIQDLILLMQS